MVCYPPLALMLAGIHDVLLISTPQDTPRFAELLGDGSQWGMSIQYAVQPSPDGLAQAFILGRSFVGAHPSVLVVGDDFFYGHDFARQLRSADATADGATVFAYHGNDPERYGVVEFDEQQRAVNIEEKPATRRRAHPAVEARRARDHGREPLVSRASTAASGSARPRLRVARQAASFIATLQRRQGLMVACPEEIALSQGWIDREQVARLAAPLSKNEYGAYLLTLLR